MAKHWHCQQATFKVGVHCWQMTNTVMDFLVRTAPSDGAIQKNVPISLQLLVQCHSKSSRLALYRGETSCTTWIAKGITTSLGQMKFTQLWGTDKSAYKKNRRSPKKLVHLFSGSVRCNTWECKFWHRSRGPSQEIRLHWWKNLALEVKKSCNDV